MTISKNIDSVWFDQNNYPNRKNDKNGYNMFINEDIEQSVLNEQHNFNTLCQKFPDVSFVVVDEIGEPQQEYGDVCNTLCFGDLGQISIEIQKEVIEKLDSDWNNIVTMIQAISDNYGSIANHAVASGCSYTAVTLHYSNGGDLSFGQSLWFEAPVIDRQYGKELRCKNFFDTNEKYLQTFLTNIQNDAIDKLFNIGEDKHSYKVKTKCVNEYQKQFVYENEKHGAVITQNQCIKN